MWKQVGLVLTISAIGLGSGTAEARFGKSSNPAPSGGGNSGNGGGGHTSHPGGGYWGGGTPYYYGYGPPRFYYDGFQSYGYPWPNYTYFNPAWGWPFLGSNLSSYGRYYPTDMNWRRPLGPPGPRAPRDPNAAPPPAQVDLRVDTGAVKNGYSVGVGLLLEGQRFGFNTKLDLFNLSANDGTQARDAITLLSMGPSALLVSTERVKWRLNGGMDVAFAPDITMIGLGLGSGAVFKLAGPVKLGTNLHLTPLPYVQVSGDAGAAVELGSVLKLRGGYRATYLDDRGNVDGVSHRDLLAGPFIGLALTP